MENEPAVYAFADPDRVAVKMGASDLRLSPAAAERLAVKLTDAVAARVAADEAVDDEP